MKKAMVAIGVVLTAVILGLGIRRWRRKGIAHS